MDYKNYIKILLNEATKEDIRKFYKTVPDDAFNKIIDSDPSTIEGKVGSDSRTVLGIYQKTPFNTTDELLNDIYTAIASYNKSKSALKNQYSKYKNVNNIDSVDTLFIVYNFIENNRRKDKFGSDEGRDVITVFENDNWKVMIPLDYKTSIRLGRMLNATWCTASSGGDTMYNQYITKGDLWIFQNKNSTKENDVAYQYARTIHYEVEFKNNQNIDYNGGWEQFLRDNKDLAPVLNQIRQYEEKFKEDKNYKYEKLVERYETSKSPYIPFMFIRDNRMDYFEKLNLTELDKNQLIQVDNNIYTTINAVLKKQSDKLVYKVQLYNRMPIYNQFGTAIYTVGKNFGICNSNDEKVTDPIFDYEKRIADKNIENKGYFYTVNIQAGKINELIIYDLTNGNKIYELDSNIVIKKITTDVDVTSNKILSVQTDNEMIVNVFIDDTQKIVTNERSIKEMKSEFFDSLTLLNEDYSHKLYQGDYKKLNDLLPILNYITLVYATKSDLESIIRREDNEFYLLYSNENSVKLIEYSNDEGGYVWIGGSGSIKTDIDFIFNDLFNTDIYPMIRDKVLNVNEVVPYIEKIYNDGYELSYDSIEYIIESMSIDNLESYYDEIIEFLDKGELELSVDCDEVFSSGSNFMNYIGYLTGDNVYDIGYTPDPYDDYWEDIFRWLQENHLEDYKKLQDKITEIAIEENLIETPDELDNNIIEEIIDNDYLEDLQYNIRESYRVGTESGTQSEIIKQFKNQYTFNEDMTKIDVTLSSLDDYLRYIENNELPDDIEEDLDVPYYGFDGFDSQFAYEYFYENLDI